MKTVTVKQTEKVAPVEVIAESIVNISAGMKKLIAGPLNKKALILLIQHAAPTFRNGAKISQSEIMAVMDGIESLEKTYLKSKPVK